MISFILNIIRFARVLIHGVKADHYFRSLLLFVGLLLLGATYFYYKMEGWSIVDALYFSVMTMSTIGYGDLAPSSDTSKLFTVVYAFLSIGAFAALVTKLVTFALELKKGAKAGSDNKDEY